MEWVVSTTFRPFYSRERSGTHGIAAGWASKPVWTAWNISSTPGFDPRSSPQRVTLDDSSVWVYVRARGHTYTHTYIAYVRTYIHAHTYIHTHIHIHYIRTYIHKHTHIHYIRTYIHTQTLHTYVRIYTHTHTYTNIHTNTHTHTQQQCMSVYGKYRYECASTVKETQIGTLEPGSE